ncbi:4'-phosphopantetheinyl transferase family protein [Streptomyces djakartensis]|uniref:4'-phosphopantetheinyl transferase family protein n=1 Tax=Streptomyces djakartensis TaxID=68193 RepID=UPI0034DFC795
MIRELLPPTVVTVEADGQQETQIALYPEEAALMLRAVPKRRREFANVRSCARYAMEQLGVPPEPILPSDCGAPSWPTGVVGSMTHCNYYCVAALASAKEMASLGIDVETNEPLPMDLLPLVASPVEMQQVGQLIAENPSVCWDRLLFSAKESVYKAWYPLTHEWLDFKEAEVTFTEDGRFQATLLVPGPWVDNYRVDRFEGRWLAKSDLIATAVALERI